MNSVAGKFAIIIGNRGFFPAESLGRARKEIKDRLEGLGHSVLLLPETATRYGAVESREEGLIQAAFIAQHRAELDGIIISLPNFGDENGIVTAVKNADLPVFIQAYPDSLEAMQPENRRDAFCGKFSVMDVFCQNKVKFTVIPPHVVAPESKEFAAGIDYFARVCRVVKGMRNLRLGAFGARVTAFKTVRVDELALQAHDINCETYDLAQLFAEMKHLDSKEVAEKIARLEAYTDCSAVPEQALGNLAALGCALDRFIKREQLDAIALRCWMEIQHELQISPCLLLSELNDRNIVAACEMDVANAVVMQALKLASNAPVCCMDWNNNYGSERDKCVLFHCGPVAASLMADRGRVEDHALLASSLGKGVSWGCNTGRLRAGSVTYGSMLSRDGKLNYYLGEGKITADQLPEEYFGCAGVVEIPDLEKVLLDIGRSGHRHHVSLGSGSCKDILHEALGNYLGMNVVCY